MPIHRIPDDLLVDIFHWTRPDTPHWRPNAIAVIALVCRWWRRLSWTLWQRPLLTTDDGPYLLSQAFDGAHNLHLRLEMGYRSHESELERRVVDAVCAGRVVGLYVLEDRSAAWLRDMVPFPGVKELTVYSTHYLTDGLALWSATSLTVLRLQQVHLGAVPATGHMLQNMAVLELSGLDFIPDFLNPDAFIHHVLAHTPRLRALCLVRLGEYDGAGFRFDQAFPTSPVLRLPNLSDIKIKDVPHDIVYGILSQIDFPALQHVDLRTYVLLEHQPVPISLFSSLLRQARAEPQGIVVDLHGEDHITICSGRTDTRTVRLTVGYSEDLLGMMRPFLLAVEAIVGDVAGPLQIRWAEGVQRQAGAEIASWTDPLTAPLRSATGMCFFYCRLADYGFWLSALQPPDLFPHLKEIAIGSQSGVAAPAVASLLLARVSVAQPLIRITLPTEAGWSEEGPMDLEIAGCLLAFEVAAILARKMGDCASMHPMREGSQGTVTISW